MIVYNNYLGKKNLYIKRGGHKRNQKAYLEEEKSLNTIQREKKNKLTLQKRNVSEYQPVIAYSIFYTLELFKCKYMLFSIQI